MGAAPFPRVITEFYALNQLAIAEPLHLCQLCHRQPRRLEVYTEDMPPARTVLPAHVTPLKVCQSCIDDEQLFIYAPPVLHSPEPMRWPPAWSQKGQ